MEDTTAGEHYQNADGGDDARKHARGDEFGEIEEPQMKRGRQESEAYGAQQTEDGGGMEDGEAQQAEEKGYEGEGGGYENAQEEKPVEEVPEGWEDSVLIEVDWEDAAWLREDDSARLKKLETLADADLLVSEQGNARIKPRYSDAEFGAPWAELCLKATCAMRTGRTLDLETLPENGPRLAFVEVPKEEAKGFILGKSGARLMQISEDAGVVSVFAKLPDPPVEADEPADPEATGDDETWQPKPEPEKVEPPAEPWAGEVGDVVEGKYGDDWHEATVLETGDGPIKVKWSFDGESESELSREELRKKEVPVIQTERLYIFGEERARMNLELKSYNLIELKAPGFVSSKGRVTDDNDGLGWSVVPLVNNGELKARVVGKGGSVRLKISKATRCGLEFVGPTSYIVGTRLEREQAISLLDLLQTTMAGQVNDLPKVLEPSISKMVFPEEANAAVVGKKRAIMNQLEEETGTLAFWVPMEHPDAPVEEELSLTEGISVEGKYGKEWHKAVILEVAEGEDSSTTVKVRWEFDGESESDLSLSEVREVLEGDAAEERKARDALPDRVMAIFGPERSRCLAELKVMVLVEGKSPGHFSATSLPPAGDGYGVAGAHLADEEVQLCQSNTDEKSRWRLAAAAANAGAEVVGNAVILAGSGLERLRCEEYIHWAVAEAASVPDAETREDVSVLAVPAEKAANLPPHVIASVETTTDTFAFFDETFQTDEDKRLVVVGHDAAKRKAAIAKLTELQDTAPWEETKWEEQGGWDQNQNDAQSWDQGKDQAWGGAAKQSWGKDSQPDNRQADKGWGDDKQPKSWDAKPAWEQKPTWNAAPQAQSWDAKPAWEEKKAAWPTPPPPRRARPAQDWNAAAADQSGSWDQSSGSQWGGSKNWGKPIGGPPPPLPLPPLATPRVPAGVPAAFRSSANSVGNNVLPRPAARTIPPRDASVGYDGGLSGKRGGDDEWSGGPAPSKRPRGPVIGASPALPSARGAYAGPASDDFDTYEQPQEEWAGPSDPRIVLSQMRFPSTIEEWIANQDVVWEGHEQLPKGWVRIWSKSRDCEYYMRLSDLFATFDLSEVEGE